MLLIDWYGRRSLFLESRWCDLRMVLQLELGSLRDICIVDGVPEQPFGDVGPRILEVPEDIRATCQKRRIRLVVYS